METSRKLILNIGGATLEAEFPTVSGKDLRSAGVDTSLDGRLITYTYLRYLLRAKPLPESHCLSLIPDLHLAVLTERRLKALIHATARGEQNIGRNLHGLLNKEESALRARLEGAILRGSDDAMPNWLHGQMPNMDAKTYQSNAAKKPGSHSS